MSHLQAVILDGKKTSLWCLVSDNGLETFHWNNPYLHTASKEDIYNCFPSYLYILYLVLNPCRLLSTKSVYSCERWKGPLSERSQSKGLVACWSETAATAKTQQWRLSTIHSHRAIREENSAPALRRHIMLPLGT